MKQFFLSTVLITLITLTHAQVNIYGTEPVNDKDLLLKSKKQKTAAWVYKGGDAAIVASIPLFIASSNNRCKARLTIKDEKVAMGLPVKAGKKISGITLSIPFGK